ncbi:MAG: hypothetical protein GC193_15365 [Cryomorphaceae bacterium]|nr:hypothetical protein [Cryomorphaceae bacterium]
MKHLLFFLFSLYFLNGAAQQEVLVPFRVGDKFGLSNTSAKPKLVVKADYDYVEPIGGGFFKFSNYTEVPETTHWVGGRVEIEMQRVTRSGVLKGAKVIVGETEHRHFSIVDDVFLIGSEESYISRNSNFYNLKGERLMDENALKFKLLGFDGREEKSKFITIFVEHIDKSHSILVFDVDKQVMATPIMTRVRDLEIDREESTEEAIAMTFVDENYEYFHKMLVYDKSTGSWFLEPFVNKRQEYFSKVVGGDGNDVVVAEPYYAEELVEMPMDVSIPAMPIEKPKPVSYFTNLKNNAALYGQTTLQLEAGVDIFFADRYATTQREPLIYRQAGKSGLIFSDTLRTAAEYDSLRYLKNQYGIFTFSHNYVYLAGKRDVNTGEWSMGVLDAKGQIVIPFEYSSLIPNLREIYLVEDVNDIPTGFGFRQPFDYDNDKTKLLTLNSTGVFTAEKNGKVGVITLQNEIVLPFEYDNIWKNDFSFLKTFRVDDEFFVYQKGDKYGAFKLNGGKEKTNDTGPIFPKVPVYVYRNYGDKSGYDVYNLAVPNNLFFCLAGSDGTVFYAP